MLSREEKIRYSRHIMMSEFGIENQEKLKQSKVLIIGAGGLGCPALQYLTAAGVGTIGIVDDDTVSESNLQRQILFTRDDVGKLKVEVAIKKLQLQNPFTQFIGFTERLNTKNALSILNDFDLLIDGSDNFATRYLVNDACVILNKPFVFGSIHKFEGQVTVFNYRNGPTYRCLFPEPASMTDTPNCATIGVLGALPGIVGTMQATEAIKIVCQLGESISGKLLVFNCLQNTYNTYEIELNPENKKIKELENNYELLCFNPSLVNSISPQELHTKMQLGEDIDIIDVREPSEFELCKISEKLIPLNTIPNNYNQIAKNKTVVLYCHHGMRSAQAIKFLQEKYSYTNLLNLEGGIHQWAMTVDSYVPTY
ncbi:MAG: molybdopterin-synthase adenylyltransferase MoeB [Bacteroidetes bacterium]|nr:molybdopterin-synthase adenylyltransferase MoeB [Bacteroidota bacterium]